MTRHYDSPLQQAECRQAMTPLLTGAGATADDAVAFKWMMRESEPIMPMETLRARQAAWCS